MDTRISSNDIEAKIMITRLQKKFLEEFDDVDIRKLSKKERDKANKTFARIQETIDRKLDMFYWLVINHPDIFLDEARELEDTTLEPHRRLFKLIKILYKMNPRFEVELHLKEQGLLKP